MHSRTSLSRARPRSRPSPWLLRRCCLWPQRFSWFPPPLNQAIGFGCLGYPSTHTRSCGFCNRSSRARCNCDLDFRAALRQSGTPIALGFALTGAYTAYELVLFAATPIPGSTGAFTLTIVGRLGVLSPLWLIELVAAYEVFRLLNPIRRRNWQMPRRLSWSKVTVGAIVGKIAAAELIKVGRGGRQSARSPDPLLRVGRCRHRRGGTRCTHSGVHCRLVPRIADC